MTIPSAIRGGRVIRERLQTAVDDLEQRIGDDAALCESRGRPPADVDGIGAG